MDLWIQIENIFKASERRVKILEGDTECGLSEAAQINASLDSAFAAVMINTNGIVIDNWINILGQSSPKHAGIIDFSSRLSLDLGKMMAVATDVVGGVFAINVGRFEEDLGSVWYFAPDTLSWESLGFRYSEFLAWTAQGNLEDFYQSFRWKDWEKDVSEIDGFNDGMLIYPYLWAKECNIETASKKVVPLKEIIGTNLEFAKKFG